MIIRFSRSRVMRGPAWPVLNNIPTNGVLTEFMVFWPYSFWMLVYYPILIAFISPFERNIHYIEALREDISLRLNVTYQTRVHKRVKKYSSYLPYHKSSLQFIPSAVLRVNESLDLPLAIDWTAKVANKPLKSFIVSILISSTNRLKSVT